MTPRRIILLVLSGVLLVGALVLTTVDIHADQRDCGSAILPRNTSQLGVDTGNVARDDFAVQEVLDDCNHDLWRQRLICAGLLVLSVGAWLVSRRQPHDFRLPGDPII